ncbi:MAG: 2-hydroxyacyl-CoA dehydratase family protein [Clostridia bacterium]|nr:2-hydroxyacyl-CoA dehydratase family protein [Clostridia bacterium]
MDINNRLEEFKKISANPKAALDNMLKDGRKVVGVMPYYAPEEAAYALGIIPFGLWGANIQASESKKYFPAFYCSIVHTVLEMGITGALAGLSAIMVPLSCDALKGMGTNWKYGVKNIPVIDVPYANNRKIAAGKEFTTVTYKEIVAKLEAIAGKKLESAEMIKAINVYNENREECLKFTKLSAQHPNTVSCVNRAAVLKSRYFMDRAAHTEMLKSLNDELSKMPEEKWTGIKVVTTGIMEDSENLMKIFDDNKISIVADQIVHESVDFRNPLPVVEADPVSGYGERLASLEGSSILFDPTKERIKNLVNLAKEEKAEGVIWVGCKFCDPEEFDYPLAKNAMDKEGIPFTSIEIDQQMVNFEQVRTIIETFKEII